MELFNNENILLLILLVCFYGKDMVNLVDGGQRSIENLKVGDRIWTLSHNGATLFEDEVMLMADNGPNRTGIYICLI